jgi:hypothetical protein
MDIKSISNTLTETSKEFDLSVGLEMVYDVYDDEMYFGITVDGDWIEDFTDFTEAVNSIRRVIFDNYGDEK